MPTRRSCRRRGWPSPPGGPRPTLPSASDPVRGTLRTAKGTSPPPRDAENQRTRYKGISYGRAAAWPAVTPPPRHLYSHMAGTWLDALLDQVDEAAGRTADTCPNTVGWLSPLQEPRVCFSHAGLRVHDALPHARRALLASHHAYSAAPLPQRHPALHEYANAVSHGLITWGDHLKVTGIHLSLFPPRDTPCPLCILPASGDHILGRSLRRSGRRTRWCG